jgi:hypothetical protein
LEGTGVGKFYRGNAAFNFESDPLWRMTMDKPVNVCVLVGSLRKASFNRRLANALISLAPSSMKLDIVEIGQLPLYNEDLETDPPPAQWIAFRQLIKAADAVLFVTPEYNRSVPAASKMHWMSAPGPMDAASGTASLVR